MKCEEMEEFPPHDNAPQRTQGLRAVMVVLEKCGNRALALSAAATHFARSGSTNVPRRRARVTRPVRPAM